METQGVAILEPNHTHFFLVPGDRWGDESPWLGRAAEFISDGAPSITILVNGGEIAWEDVSLSVQAGRPVIVISGSDRAADEISAAIAGENSDRRALGLASSGLLRVVNISEGFDGLAKVIEEITSGEEPK